jgi:hypothetical protein
LSVKTATVKCTCHLFKKRSKMRLNYKHVYGTLLWLALSQTAAGQTKEAMFQRFKAAAFPHQLVDKNAVRKTVKPAFPIIRSTNELSALSQQKPSPSRLDDILLLLSQLPQHQTRRGIDEKDLAKAGLQKDLVMVYQGAVRINAYATDKAKADVLSLELEKWGFRQDLRSDKVLSGWLPIEALTAASNSPHVLSIRAAEPLKTQGGVVDAQSDVAQLSNLVRQNRLVNGSGIKVGIVSNSYNLLNKAQQSVLLGDLPGPGNPNGFTTPVQVVREANSAELIGIFTDEGRAMAEIVHDIAPGAALAFYAPVSGDGLGMATAFRELAKAGCNIIVDDVGSVVEPIYQDNLSNIVSDSLVDAGIIMVAACGNYGGGESRNQFQFHEDTFKPVLANIGNVGGYFHNFDTEGGFFPFIPIVLDNDPSPNTAFILQWDSPWGSLCNGCQSSPNDLVLLYYDVNFNFITFSEADVFGDALITSIVNYTPGPALVYVAVFQSFDETFQTPLAGRFKIANFVGARSELESSFGATLFRNTPTVSGGDNSAKGLSVAAAAWYNTPAGAALWNRTFAGTQLSNGQFVVSTPIPLSPILGHTGAPSVLLREDSSSIVTNSSLGGSPVLFDRVGNRLPQPEIRQIPLVTGADGVQTSFFIRRINEVPFPFFFGTSASAPAAAAAAALLTPTQVKNYLTSTALDMDNPYQNGLNQNPADPLFSRGYDFASGFGLIQTNAAIEQYIRDAGIQNLTIAPVCQNSTEGRWVINNPNGFGVSITLSVFGSRFRLPGQTGFSSASRTFIAPPGNFNFFTERTRAITTARITWLPATGSGTASAQSAISAGAWSNCTSGAKQSVQESSNSTITVSPNPAPGGRFNVGYTAITAGRGIVEITDGAGKPLYREERTFVKGRNNFVIAVPGFAKGSYLVRITNGTTRDIQQVVLQ